MSKGAVRSKLTFCQQTYRIVKQIPVGEIKNYKEVATEIGRPEAARVVARCLSRNFNPDIPCHRVVRSDGQLGGYNRGQKAKLEKLKYEGVEIRNRRIVYKDKNRVRSL